MRVASPDPELRDEEARRFLFLLALGGRLLREGLHEVREIQLAVFPDDGPEVGMRERDLLEARSAPPEARDLRIDDQRLEARERLAVRVGQREAVDLELERERVEAHVADRERALVVVGDEGLGLRTQELRDEPEPQGGVHGDERRGHRRDEDQLPRTAKQFRLR